ncbi:hypothetical protein NDU88_006629 [Pleurodeles waltl]|uniref:Uncharacterized protein n=1 Tax=Pleurodeles waltl TaxID=8319 RepID=A0AAV7MDE2_PLEWA|nr:hypothetical protein NDU88_006629 [Pleurodeles waltl]
MTLGVVHRHCPRAVTSVLFFPRHTLIRRELPCFFFLAEFDSFVEVFCARLWCVEMSPKTGFKPCEDCHRTLSVTDPHCVCLWCLERDHDPKSCSECQAMHPKALREWSLKLMAARHLTPRRSRSRSRGRSRDQSQSHHHTSSSKSSGQGKKKSSKKFHRSQTSLRRSADATRTMH